MCTRSMWARRHKCKCMQVSCLRRQPSWPAMISSAGSSKWMTRRCIRMETLPWRVWLAVLQVNLRENWLICLLAGVCLPSLYILYLYLYPCVSVYLSVYPSFRPSSVCRLMCLSVYRYMYSLAQTARACLSSRAVKTDMHRFMEIDR